MVRKCFAYPHCIFNLILFHLLGFKLTWIITDRAFNLMHRLSNHATDPFPIDGIPPQYHMNSFI